MNFFRVYRALGQLGQDDTGHQQRPGNVKCIGQTAGNREKAIVGHEKEAESGMGMQPPGDGVGDCFKRSCLLGRIVCVGRRNVKWAHKTAIQCQHELKTSANWV